MTDAPDWGIPPDHEVGEDCHTRGGYWHLPEETWSAVHAKATGYTIKVGIGDTGINAHPDLPTVKEERSFVNGQSPGDRNGHGTHCAGTAVGRNGIGVAPEAELYNAKVLSNGGSGSSAGIAAGIEWLTAIGCDVISLSLGGGSSYGPTNRAIDAAFAQGTIVVAAAGNSGYSGRNTIGWPAKYMGCLCIGATREDGNIANFSSGGEQMDCATPGQNIVSAKHTGGLVSMSGTSMATPFLAGLMAIIQEIRRREGYPEWRSVEAVREFLSQFSEDRGAPGHDVRFGWGVPMYENIVNALINEDIQWI